MPIGVRCPSCDKAYHLSDDQAGQRVRCRACRAEFDVPGRVETLEAVPRDAVFDRTVSPASPLFDPPPPPPKKSRKWAFLLGGLAAVLLVFLGCTGSAVVFTTQAKRELAKMQAAQDAKDAADRREAKEAKERDDRDRDERDKRREEERDKADRQARADVEKLVKQVVGGETGGIKLPNLPELPDLDLPKLRPVRDLDDCVAKLRSRNRSDRLSAIKWIGEKQSFPDANEKRRVIDALSPLTDDEDAQVKKEAVFWKLALELDP